MKSCNDCMYYADNSVCLVTHVLHPKPCGFNTAGIKDMHICFNCKDWCGAGDWGLSCASDYYMATSNGFREACERFKKR